MRGRVIGVSGRPTRGGKVVLKVGLTDGDSALDLVWFNQPWIRRKLEHYRGEMVAYGQVKQVGWSIEMHSPEFELLDEDAEADAFARIVPVYPLVEGLYQKVVRKAASSALEHYLGQVDDPLPEALLRREGLKPLRWSLRQMHQPTSEEERLQARKRLVFEEFFYLQVGLALQRAQVGGALGISFGRWLRTVGRGAVPAAVRAHARPAPGDRRDLGGHGTPSSDEPPAAGRRGLGKDRGSGLCDARRRAVRLSGGAHGAHRDPRRTARRQPQAPL